MACIVMVVDHPMSLVLGAELGPKADPTTTTYVPRPEWYFFFLFELLRVIKPPELVAARDDRRADDLHGPAVPAAVLSTAARSGAPSAARSPRSAGILTIVAMAYLTYLGAVAGSPNEIDMDGRRRKYEDGQARGGPVRLPRPATRSARTATTVPGRT